MIVPHPNPFPEALKSLVFDRFQQFIGIVNAYCKSLRRLHSQTWFRQSQIMWTEPWAEENRRGKFWHEICSGETLPSIGLGNEKILKVEANEGTKKILRQGWIFVTDRHTQDRENLRFRFCSFNQKRLWRDNSNKIKLFLTSTSGAGGARCWFAVRSVGYTRYSTDRTIPLTNLT